MVSTIIFWFADETPIIGLKIEQYLYSIRMRIRLIYKREFSILDRKIAFGFGYLGDVESKCDWRVCLDADPVMLRLWLA